METAKTSREPNRLINEKSPYLLQHANNPVDWYPWSEEAFQKAEKEDKPVFLSIGYSTCHWCHVMERESFEDEEVAGVLNKHFISVKVDREERPDVDNIYMTVCQAMTGQGGWPLTIIMTADKKPFFAGTYFPKESRYGMPGLMDILNTVAEKWEENRDALVQAAGQIADSIRTNIQPSAGQFSEDVFHHAYHSFYGSFDKKYGGFGPAPKFPTPHNLMFLLRYYKKYQQEEAMEMVEKTLQSMYRGGIHDHIGYGFSRYSTDNKWLVPHFEKMLYDNALLAFAYLEAYQVTGSSMYRKTAENIFEYVLRDMTSPEGAFYSAEDADSEGEEGKFYVWSPEEVTAVLGEDDGRLFCRYYDISEEGNFEGKSIPNLINFNGSTRELERVQKSCLPKLFKAREKRVHPYKDDKILTSWNGLMIAALAKGGQVLQQPKYSKAAAKAVDFIYKNLFDDSGRLLARYRDGEAAYPAYLDDYAFMIWGLIELYQATFDYSYIEKALSLNEDMIKLFWDHENSGFFFYGSDGEQLITRPKEVYDGAVPSGNSVAAFTLIKLARLTGSEQLQKYADKQLRAFAGNVSTIPTGHSFMMLAAMLNSEAPLDIVIVGSDKKPEEEPMIKMLQTKFIPEAATAYHSETDKTYSIPAAGDKSTVDGQTAAYICKNFACQPPITNIKELERSINNL